MKIFVTVGTQIQPFDRLFEMIDELEIDAEIKMQTGSSSFISTKYECNKFVENFNTEIENADVIICHGGIGSILTGLNQAKRIIAVPRLSAYSEHVNDHQVEIVDEYTKLGYIKQANNQKELQCAIDEIMDFKPKEYKSNNKEFINNLEEVIRTLC